ncbi:murein hydrolase activator EnvC family protein [Patescibacteria group bacterium]
MKKITNTLKGKIGILTIFVLVLPLVTVYAEDAPEDEKVPVEISQNTKNQQFLLQLKHQLQNSRNDYFQIGKSVDDAKERLLETADSISLLNKQLANFDYLIGNSQAKIVNVQKQIAQKRNQISVIKEDIDIKKIELENQKLLLKDYLKLLYLQENDFFDKAGNADISASKLLLGDASVGDSFKKIEYFSILEQTGQNIFTKLDTIKEEYRVKRTELQQTRQKLTKLDVDLKEEQKTMKLQKNAKYHLLKQTEGEEEIYRELIAQSKREQLEIIQEINVLKQNLLFVQEKIAEDGENFNPDNYQDLINPNIRAIYDFEMAAEFATGEKLNWPVEPTRGISAYFRDSSYKAVFGIPHNAIDIPILQESSVRAPAAGVVYKVKDNGDNSYAYVIIAHKGGLLTVYGHLTEILVDERDIVLPGEVIGLSGGIPGTKGAGYLTTGAHLHFEVIKNGVHINPLFMLDLEKLSEDYIPESMKEKEDEEEEVESEEEKD